MYESTWSLLRTVASDCWRRRITVFGEYVLIRRRSLVAHPVGRLLRWFPDARMLAKKRFVPASGLYFGFVSLAVYDAVVAIERGYEPYADQPRAHANASPEVAAATAAYRVLSHYFPASVENLAADYAAFLARIPNGVGEVHGKRVGEAAAARVIRLRQNDGRGAAVSLNVVP
jgi:hypothetical protein